MKAKMLTELNFSTKQDFLLLYAFSPGVVKNKIGRLILNSLFCENARRKK